MRHTTNRNGEGCGELCVLHNFTYRFRRFSFVIGLVHRAKPISEEVFILLLKKKTTRIPVFYAVDEKRQHFRVVSDAQTVRLFRNSIIFAYKLFMTNAPSQSGTTYVGVRKTWIWPANEIYDTDLFEKFNSSE